MEPELAELRAALNSFADALGIERYECRAASDRAQEKVQPRVGRMDLSAPRAPLLSSEPEGCKVEQHGEDSES